MIKINKIKNKIILIKQIKKINNLKKNIKYRD